MARMLTPLHKKAWFAFLLAHDKILKDLDQQMQSEGVVSLGVYDLLLLLERSPQRRLKMSVLATQVSRSMSGATRAVDRLEREGLIERVASKEDRRAIYAVLTDKGQAERERAWPVYERGIQSLFAEKLGLHEAEVILKAFERIRPIPTHLSS